METLHVKNMVCPRCITSVTTILKQLDIAFSHVILGEICLPEKISKDLEIQFQKALKREGFELIPDKHTRISNKIKAIIIEEIYSSTTAFKNLSVLLSEKLGPDYSHLSNIFSKTEGKSIQQFQLEVKTTRIKELLEYDELSIAEIAFQLGYGNAAYLSTQFKKATGITPSEYKKQILKNRTSLDEL